MADFKRDPTGVTGILSLEGAWPPTRAEELRKALSDALAACEQLVIRLAGVTGVSFPFYQLLVSTQRSAGSSGKRVVLKGPVPFAVLRNAKRMGLVNAEPRREGQSGPVVLM